MRLHGWEEQHLLSMKSIHEIEFLAENHILCKHTHAHTQGEKGGEKHIRTLIFWESVNNIARRSIPIPQPPVGGNPNSRAVQNVSS